MAVKLRDWATQQGVNVGYDEPTGKVTLAGKGGRMVNFTQGSPEAAQYGLTLGQEGYHSLDPSDTRLGNALGLGTQTAPAPMPTPRQNYQTGVQDILSQLRSKAGQTPDITGTPYYKASMDAAKQSAGLASQQAMEQLNARGILNSTVTGDRVAQIQQQGMTQILPSLIEKAYKMQEGEFGNLLNMLNAYSGLEQQEYTRGRQADLDKIAAEDRRITQEQKKIADAWTRVENMGYVDNLASIALGIPIETSPYKVQKDVQERQNRLDIARENNAAAMARTQASEAEAMARTKYTQGMTPDKINALALEMAKADPRLDEGDFTLAQLFDAYHRQLIGNYSGGNTTPTKITDDSTPSGKTQTDEIVALIKQSRSEGESDESIRAALESRGYNPADYGL